MKERAQILNEFGLKLIAILFMTLDHIGLFLMQHPPATNSAQHVVGYVFRALGRIAFPLFAFMLAEGIQKSHNPKAYLFRIAIVWGVSVSASALAAHFASLTFEPDPLTDLLMDGLVLYCLSLPKWKKLYALLPLSYIGLSYGVQLYENYHSLVSVVWLPSYLRVGYGIFGLLIALGFFYSGKIASFIAKKSLAPLGEDAPAQYEDFVTGKSYRGLVNLTGMAFLFFFTLVFWGFSYLDIRLDTIKVSLETYCLLALIFLYLYNGKRGPDNKAFRILTYSYFPVHLAILYVIFHLILE
jgi:hypothetical protein